MSSAIKQFNFTQEQVAKLMSMQDELNTYIHPEWLDQQFNWHLAMIDECLEIHGHLGWKWWKKDYKLGLTENNKAQIKLEVIDLLHFVMSQTLVDGYNVETVKKSFGHSYDTSKGLEYNTLGFMRHCMTNGYSVRQGWALLAHCVDLTEQEILETYTQKYVLNKFRQDHGYKDGSYVKEWELLGTIGEVVDGVAEGYTSKFFEDNQCLTSVAAEMQLAGFDTTNETALYIGLEKLYNSRLNK
jgi:dimeric dUTPase (all-alpha-NTP-PPase superfamily)